jgi:RNA recognition motif-containing protein
MISNFPLHHDEKLIFQFCNTFVEVKNVEIILNKETEKFEGSAYIYFISESDAKKAYN